MRIPLESGRGSLPLLRGLHLLGQEPELRAGDAFVYREGSAWLDRYGPGEEAPPRLEPPFVRFLPTHFPDVVIADAP